MKFLSSPRVLKSLINGSLSFANVRQLTVTGSKCVNASTGKNLGHKLSLNPVERNQQSDCPARSLTSLSEEELAFKESAARYAKEKIEPLVRTMDQSGVMDEGVIKGLFDNGVS